VTVYRGWRWIGTWYSREFLFTEFYTCWTRMALYWGVLYRGRCDGGGVYVTYYSVFECDLYQNGFQLCSFIRTHFTD